ncbi:MAG: type IV toxin-antitoxin system AbiEi family antitoxin domain-containing protein [Thermoplasmata archaeon]
MKEREFLELMGREPTITTRQVAAILGDQSYAKLYLHRLVKKGLIRRLRMGFYTVYDDPVVYATYVYHPSYISLWYAFHHHGTTTQLPRTIEVMTYRKGAIPQVEFIRTRELWGYHTIRYGDFKVFMADLEKAVIDAVTTERVPLDEIQAAVRECDTGRLEEYALGMGLSAMKKIGYVAETTGRFMESLYERVRHDRNYVRFFAAEKGNRWRVVGD